MEQPRIWARGRALLSVMARYAVLLAVAATIIIPLIYTVIGGFRTTGELRADPIGLPDDWYPARYLEILQGDRFWTELMNSVVIAAVTTLLTVGLSALAAFAFARLAFRGREALFTLFVLGLLFPSAVAILPLYILVRMLGLLDDPLGVIAAAGRLLPAPDDRHPAAVLPADPDRAGGRRAHRRVRHVRILLAHRPAAVTPRTRDGRGPRRGGQLEPVPAAAPHPWRG